MKKIILLLSLILGITTVSNAQCDLPYKPFSEFSNDTLAFLDYNFETRSDCYIGKTVAEVIKDLYFEPVGFDGRNIWPTEKSETGFAGIMLYIYTHGRQRHPLKDYYINIYWEEPYPTRALLKTLPNADKESNWTKELYDALKDLKIKHVSPNSYIKMKQAADLRRARERTAKQEQ